MGSVLLFDPKIAIGQTNYYFFDDFSGPALNPLWQASLPSARCGTGSTIQPAAYIGPPNFDFDTVDSSSVIEMTNEMGPMERTGWSLDTNFVTNAFRYEVRFNTLTQGPGSSIDAFVEIWIMNATNTSLYDIVSPFGGDFGNSPYAFFGSSIDNYFATAGFQYQDDTWYRLVLQAIPGQNIRASICDDNDNELVGQSFQHTSAAFGAGFVIAVSQAVGPSGVPYPDEVAVDYVSVGPPVAPPMITSQPVSVTVTNQGQAEFTVTAFSTEPLTYQWQRDGTNLVDGGEISGSTNDVLTLDPVSANDIADYAVIVANALGSATSDVATLTIFTNPPVITGQPRSLTVTNQSRAIFSVTAYSLEPMTFQWQRNGTNMFDGGEISGSMSSNLTFYPASFNDVGNYAVVITNIFGSVTSSVATLAIVAQSALTNGLLAYYPFNGSAYDASGNGNNGTNFGGTYVPDRFGLPGEAIYLDTNYVNTGFVPPLGRASRTFSGWFNVAPSSGTQTLLAYGSPSLEEQIYLKINPSGTFALDISSYVLSTAGTYNDANWHQFVVIIPTSSVLSNVVVYLDGVVQTNLTDPFPAAIINTVSAHALMMGEYFVLGNQQPMVGGLDDIRVYNRALSDAEVQLLYGLESTTPDAGPIVVAQPLGVTTTNGGLARFSIGLSGLAPFAYHWQQNGTNLANGGDFSGVTSSNLTISPAAPKDAGLYSVIATNAYGSVTSSPALLTVKTLFTWRPIASPQLVGLPFGLTIQAENITNGIAANFSGSVALSASGGVHISPTNSGPFTNGVWTGKISVAVTANNLVLTASDALGDTASANAINVIAPPQLGLDVSDNIALLYWPVVGPIAVVQVCSNLPPTKWTPASGEPAQLNGEYLFPVDTTGPHRFFRIQFSSP